MGNLLTRKNTFDWTDLVINRNEAILDLGIAISEARRFNDRIYSSPDLYDFQHPWGLFFQFLWEGGMNYQSFKQRYTWIGTDEFQTLINLTYLLGNTTERGALIFAEFDDEFRGGHNSYIGTTDVIREPLIFSEATWETFHTNNVRAFSFQERCDHTYYFLRFFTPNNELDINPINESIRAGRADNSILRLDYPGGVGQQIHVHFNVGQNNVCALNIDGTWKHPFGNFVINRRSCELLCEWGFGLPIEYYGIL